MSAAQARAIAACLWMTLAGSVTAQTPVNPADRAVARSDANSTLAHEQLLEKARSGRIDVYFAGDSITRRWGATDYPDFLAHWRRTFTGWNAANFGWGGDTTQNILWRLENGELDGVSPRVMVLLAGTNNVGSVTPAGDTSARADDIANGVKAIVRTMQLKAPDAIILLMAIFPRRDNIAVMPTIDAINVRLATFADGQRVRLLNINDRLTDQGGRLRDDVSADGLHLTLTGYEVWADALRPVLGSLLGRPAATDLAPPATGDPSAQQRTR